MYKLKNNDNEILINDNNKNNEDKFCKSYDK